MIRRDWHFVADAIHGVLALAPDGRTRYTPAGLVAQALAARWCGDHKRAETYAALAVALEREWTSPAREMHDRDDEDWTTHAG